MSFVVHDSQSTFVENRLIIDKVIVNFEAFHSLNYGKINDFSNFSLKFNLNKVFDIVDTNYLEVIMTSIMIYLSLVTPTIKCVNIVTL